jgi:hypothetical protein
MAVGGEGSPSQEGHRMTATEPGDVRLARIVVRNRSHQECCAPSGHRRLPDLIYQGEDAGARRAHEVGGRRKTSL